MMPFHAFHSLSMPVLAGAAVLLVSSISLAHVSYRDLDAAPTLVNTTFSGGAITDPCTGKTSGCQSSNAFTRYGWRNGTGKSLGDSHYLTTNAEFWKFHLSAPQTVTITFVQGVAGLDPAFSLYSGLLPVGGHDDEVTDPLNPVDDVNFCAVASPKDAHALPWTYQSHDGYRDTAAYSTTGGLDQTQCSPLNPYVGQFDAFAGWSMANDAQVWSSVAYLTSVSATPFTGHNGGTHVAGNSSTVAGTGETLTVTLPAGDYMIAAGGEGCSDATGACTLPRYYGTVTLTKSAATVPAVGVVGRCEAALGMIACGVAALRRRQRR